MAWREKLKKQGVRDASIIIAVFTVLSQVVGLVREAVLASMFGTSAEYDLLLLAVAIPGMVGSMLMVTVPSAGIPFIQNVKTPAGFRLLASPFVYTNALLSAAAAVIVWLCLPALLNVLATGINAKQLTTVVMWGRISCVFIIFRGFESTFRALQHREDHFLASTLTPFAYNAVMILTLISVYPSLGAPAYLLGITLALATQSLLLSSVSIFLSREQQADGSRAFNGRGYSTYFMLVFGIEALILMLEPIDRMLAGRFLSGGYVSAINYATVLYSVPIRIIIASVATAIFPLLSRDAAGTDMTKVAKMYHRALAACVFVIFPLSVFGWVFRYDLISILLERGRFDAESTRMTAELSAWFFSAVPLIAASTFQWRVLYALQDWKWFAVTRILSLLAKVFVALLFIEQNWSFALGGGTLILYAISFALLEAHLISRHKARYASDTWRQIGVASMWSLVISATSIVGALVFRWAGVPTLISIVLTAAACGLIILHAEKKCRIVGLFEAK